MGSLWGGTLFKGETMAMEMNKNLLPFSRELRKNMTKEERHLWYDFLRDYPVRFRRQQIIGNYIVDFYCHSAELVVELDGSQHCEPEALEQDRIREDYLCAQGLYVFRISNLDVTRNFEGVCTAVDELVKARTR